MYRHEKLVSFRNGGIDLDITLQERYFPEHSYRVLCNKIEIVGDVSPKVAEYVWNTRVKNWWRYERDGDAPEDLLLNISEGEN